MFIIQFRGQTNIYITCTHTYVFTSHSTAQWISQLMEQGKKVSPPPQKYNCPLNYEQHLSHRNSIQPLSYVGALCIFSLHCSSTSYKDASFALFIDELRTQSRTQHHGRGKIQNMQRSPVDCTVYHHTPVQNAAWKGNEADHEELRLHLPS